MSHSAFPATSLICQLSTIAQKEHRTIASTPRGVLLYACIELPDRDPRRPPLSLMTSHDVPPGNPALTSWLRTFPRSAHSSHHVRRRSEPLSTIDYKQIVQSLFNISWVQQSDHRRSLPFDDMVRASH